MTVLIKLFLPNHESSIPSMVAVDETVLEASMTNGVLYTDDDGTAVTELIEGDMDSSILL